MLVAVLFTSQPVGAQNLVQVTVSFAQARYDIAEGESQQITINLNADPQRTVIIPITVTGYFGVTSADYSVPHSVVFTSGDTSRTITFAAFDDTVDDDDEEVELDIGATLPAGVTAGRQSYTDVYIIDDDIPESLTVRFERGQKFREGGRPGIVLPKTERCAGARDRHPHRGDQPAWGHFRRLLVPCGPSVTFASDEQSKKIEFAATQDTEDDDWEAVRVSIGSPLPSGVSTGLPHETVVRNHRRRHCGPLAWRRSVSG